MNIQMMVERVSQMILLVHKSITRKRSHTICMCVLVSSVLLGQNERLVDCSAKPVKSLDTLIIKNLIKMNYLMIQIP